MKVYALIMSDRDMRPRCDRTTTAVFANREDALAAMEADIDSAIANELTSDCEIERNPYADYAVTSDDRLSWKVEERIVRGMENGH